MSLSRDVSKACPLCGSAILKYRVHFRSYVSMCSNIECPFPWHSSDEQSVTSGDHHHADNGQARSKQDAHAIPSAATPTSQPSPNRRSVAGEESMSESVMDHAK
ncbi:uncharacterized protein BYT42DRAFT_618239 [Radiomyces spectabilis]|uniref:uncharacterized protein n=1 Tax=Radiomyces spectabilis TaxID=64574 RepID=UPI0022201D70|nr:uncharacterized protein BYT42DRAFT_618239 [Radiomyces spectabilis]KAI8366732.1 hypothetical protein BYT42DRAFT_618239 [Radiomyces spectabilis]